MGPKLAVAVFVWKQGKILALRRCGATGNGKWCPPGGHVEFKEHPEDAAHRETLEETDMHIDNVRFVGYTSDVVENDTLHYITLYYNADWRSGEPRITEPDKCAELRWVDPKEFPTPSLKGMQSFIQLYGIPKA